MFEIIISNTPFILKVVDKSVTLMVDNYKFIWQNEFEIVDVRKLLIFIVHLVKHAEFSSENARMLKEAELKELFENNLK